MELRHYWAIIVRRCRTLLWIVLVPVITVILLSLITTPVYKFTSKILIKSSDPKLAILGVLPTDLTSLGSVSADLVMQSQLKLVQSYPLFNEMIANLRLEKKSGQLFTAQDILNPSSIALIRGKKGVTFRNPQSTQLIEVDAYSDQPKQAVEMANQLADGIVNLYSHILREQAKKARQYIQAQVYQMSAELRDAEKALYEFRMANQTSDLTYYREKILSTLATMEEGRDTAIRDTLEAERKVKLTLAKLKTIPELTESSITYQVNPRIDYLKKKVADQEADVASNLKKLTPEHTTVKQSLATLEKYKNLLKKEVNEIFSDRSKKRNTYYDTLIESLGTNEINAALYTGRQQIFGELIANKVKQLSQYTQKEMEQVPLERRVTAIKDNFTKLLSNEQTAKLAEVSALSNAVIVEKASMPKERENIKRYFWFPQRTRMAVLTAMLSLLIGLIVIFFQEYLRNSVGDLGEAESAFRVPVFASLPGLDSSGSFKTFKGKT